MLRSRSSLLFCLILVLSFALVSWWTTFQVLASAELAAAGQHLVAGDMHRAALALGAADTASLSEVAERRRLMFASEGIFFALVLLLLGWLYVASVRREALSRTAQDRFLAGATHELKTPLATIALLLQSLQDDRVSPAKRQQYLTTGLQEIERLERGLDNVLTAAGLRTAARQALRLDGDLAADLRRAVLALQGRALAGNVTITTATPPQLRLCRDADAIQLVLRNLIDNAIKYSPTGGAVHIVLEEHAGEARLAVHDQGRGLDAIELTHAFEPFWRGSDTATGGTGLGLHLVRQLVQAHGGSVTATSPGRDAGSTFAVRLPMAGTP